MAGYNMEHILALPYPKTSLKLPVAFCKNHLPMPLIDGTGPVNTLSD